MTKDDLDDSMKARLLLLIDLKSLKSGVATLNPLYLKHNETAKNCQDARSLIICRRGKLLHELDKVVEPNFFRDLLQPSRTGEGWTDHWGPGALGPQQGHGAEPHRRPSCLPRPENSDLRGCTERANERNGKEKKKGEKRENEKKSLACGAKGA